MTDPMTKESIMTDPMTKESIQKLYNVVMEFPGKSFNKIINHTKNYDYTIILDNVSDIKITYRSWRYTFIYRDTYHDVALLVQDHFTRKQLKAMFNKLRKAYKTQEDEFWQKEKVRRIENFHKSVKAINV